MPLRTSIDALPVTVPQELHDAVARAESEAFAISYLCGAQVIDGRLRARTNIARERLMASRPAMKALAAAGLRMGFALSHVAREPIKPISDALKANGWTGGRPGQPAVPITDDGEFQRLSIKDKISHHREAAYEARTKAGPMWKNGKPASPEDLPGIR